MRKKNKGMFHINPFSELRYMHDMENIEYDDEDINQIEEEERKIREEVRNMTKEEYDRRIKEMKENILRLVHGEDYLKEEEKTYELENKDEENTYSDIEKIIMKEKKNYKSDISFKHLFTSLKTEKLINILNFILDKNYSIGSSIVFGRNEQYNIIGNHKKNILISDLVIILTDNKTLKKEKVLIEFQSKKDKTMGDRIFVYALDNSKFIDGIRKIPQTITIYAVPGKPQKGFDTVDISFEEFIINGKDYGRDNIITIKNKFINLLAIKFEDYKNTPIEILKIFTLHKYRNNPKYIKKMNFEEILDECHNYIDTLDGEEKNIIEEILYKLIIDIEIACKKGNYEEELKMIQERTLTFQERVMSKVEKLGISKGREEGREEGEKQAKIKNAISLIGLLDNKVIAEKLELPLEIVEKLEKDNKIKDNK